MKLTNKEGRALLNGKAKKPPSKLTELQKALKKAQAEAEAQRFIALVKDKTGITLTPEHVFHPTRKWRFDFCNVELKIAIEVDGGAFSGGRHTRGKGFCEDMKKRNAAVSLGWKPIHIVPAERWGPYIIETLNNLIKT